MHPGSPFPGLPASEDSQSPELPLPGAPPSSTPVPGGSPFRGLPVPGTPLFRGLPGLPMQGAPGAGGRRHRRRTAAPLCFLSPPPPPAASTLSRPRCRRLSRPGPPLEPPALSLRRARLCLPSQRCQPCLRVRLALPAAGRGKGGGAGAAGSLGSAGSGSSHPWQHPTPFSRRARRCPRAAAQLPGAGLQPRQLAAGVAAVPGTGQLTGESGVHPGAGHRGCGCPTSLTPRFSQWQVQFDCFPAESGWQVLVSLRTIPDRGLTISSSHLVTTEMPGKAGRDPGGCPRGDIHIG